LDLLLLSARKITARIAYLEAFDNICLRFIKTIKNQKKTRLFM